MSFFSGGVKGPQVTELRGTFNNLCAMLTQDERYRDGIDASGTATLLNDIYYYVTGDRNQRIRLPAPAIDPTDKYRVMWPEGATVNSRARSNASSRYSKVPSLSGKYTQKDANRASSVVSSSIASSKHRYIPFASDDEDTDAEAESKHRKPHSRHGSVRQSSVKSSNVGDSPYSFRSRQRREKNNTVRINGNPLSHSQSIEAIRNAETNNIENNEEDNVEPLQYRKPASRRQYNGPMFADE